MMEQDLFIEYKKNPSIELRNEIVEKHLYMVDILIRKYLGKGVEYDDLYQVGALALVSAVERFDPDKGFEFSSFATPTILGEIKKYFRDKQWSPEGSPPPEGDRRQGPGDQGSPVRGAAQEAYGGRDRFGDGIHPGADRGGYGKLPGLRYLFPG